MRLVYFVFIVLAATVFAHESKEAENELQSAGEKIVDRLAVNLAGALVKSMFPEMDKKEKKPPQPSEVRRRPVSSNLMDPEMNYSQDQAAYGMMNTQDAPNNPFSMQNPEYQRVASQKAIPMDYSSKMTDMALLSSVGSGLLSGGSGDSTSINNIRNRQYVQELAKHQTELNTYAAKQMAYIENQKRYQQAMIDHQAGAALLMQQQQQQAINEQLQQLKAGYNSPESRSVDNTGGYVLTDSPGVRLHQAKAPVREFEEDDITAGDEHLKNFFREQYGIDFESEHGNLSDSEKATLRALKKELLKNKERVLNKGSFATMKALKRRVQANEERSFSSCPKCQPISFPKLRGAWTLVYGDAELFIQSLGDRGNQSRSEPACLGLEVGKSHGEGAAFNLFYRNSEKGNELHETEGRAYASATGITFDIVKAAKYCMVHNGPSESERYEYVIFTKTGENDSCRNFYIFARNTDEFNRRHFDDVNEFMLNLLKDYNAPQMTHISKSELCELGSP
ncbi:unnamed protein product [Auanema sp. JU1783]|nr:unnamed protein product [Auanema sp. JU1783]